jgi:hypothetical protein
MQIIPIPSGNSTLFSQQPVYPGRVALPSIRVEVSVPRISRDRALARIRAKWLDDNLHHPRTPLKLTELLSAENVEAVALDLYSQYDEDLAERDRRQRLILAWQQPRPRSYNEEPAQITSHYGVNWRPAIAALCAALSMPTFALIRSIRTASPIPRHPDAAR